MKKLKVISSRIITTLTVVMTLGFVAPAVGLAVDSPAGGSSSSTKTAVCEGAGIVSGASGCSDGGFSVNGLIKNIVEFFVILIGAIAVIMIIVGGFRYITSGGDSNKTSSAKNTILYAIIGLVVVLFAQGIVTFVLNTADGTQTNGSGASNSLSPSRAANQ